MILTYGRENVLNVDGPLEKEEVEEVEGNKSGTAAKADVKLWKDENLRMIRLAGNDGFVALKYNLPFALGNPHAQNQDTKSLLLDSPVPDLT